jgi:hypothetical protein
VLAGHDRYEALAGAIALGEATPAERAAFDAHAAGCAPCRADLAAAETLAGTFEAARSAECWRPAIGTAIERRIRETRRSRMRLSVGALTWCVALSLAVDLAFAGGFTSRVAHAFDAREATASVAAAAPAHPAAPPAALRADSLRLVARPRAAARRPHPAFRVAARPRPATPDSGALVPAQAPVPDVLAGLDLYGKAHRAARSVALGPKKIFR